MRSLLPALVLAAVAAAPAQGATRNFGVSGFDRIRVDGPYRVRVTTGIAPFARATGSQSALDRVTIRVDGRTLIVGASRAPSGGFPGTDSGAAEIEIGTHELTAAWLNGAGALAINKVKGLTFDLSVQGAGSASIGAASVDQLRVNLSGAATASIAGIAPNLKAVVRGAGGLDASALTIKDATVGAEGTVTVSANVTNSAKVEAQGATAVSLTGGPACTVRAAGSATVSGCR